MGVVVSPSRSRSRLPAVEVDRRALTRGALYGLAVIAPISIGVEVLDAVDLLGKGPVVFIPAVAILCAFFLAGFKAARAAATSPYTHGALAGLGSFTAWLTLRMAAHLVLGERLIGKEGDTTLTIVMTVATVGLLSMSGGILGALVAAWNEGRSQ